MSELADLIIHLGNQLERIGMRNTIYSMVSRYGIEFKAGHRTHCPEFHVPKECFRNAYGLAIASGLTYVEGYISVGKKPIHHAWCIDSIGQVVDPTIADPTIVDYFGIPFDLDFVGRSIFESRYYGVLDNERLKSIYTTPAEQFLSLEWLHRARAY